MLDPLGLEGVGHDVCRTGQRRVDIAAGDDAGRQEIAALVQARCPVGQRRRWVGHRFEHVVIDVDRGRGLTGGLPGRRRDGGEGVPDIASRLPSATNSGQSRVSRPWTRSPGTSRQVTTATTPG